MKISMGGTAVLLFAFGCSSVDEEANPPDRGRHGQAVSVAESAEGQAATAPAGPVSVPCNAFPKCEQGRHVDESSCQCVADVPCASLPACAPGSHLVESSCSCVPDVACRAFSRCADGYVVDETTCQCVAAK
jgi:hypothetical protein